MQGQSWRWRLGMWLAGREALSPGAQKLAAVTARVDDGPGWQTQGMTAYDRDAAEVQSLYHDTLHAWREHAHARRAIDITTDFAVSDGFAVSSPLPTLNTFIQQFWHHRQNRMWLRLPEMSDELARAGDLFVVLFRNASDGMSYVRFVPKDRIARIETAANDWERELIYHETQEAGETRRWHSPESGYAPRTRAVMLHYAVNRPIGALLGESDIGTIVRWFDRYDRMLADRVRLNWALRSFLWFVQVPTARVRDKVEQYRRPPDAGSIIVHDDAEQWRVQSPNLRANDARHDLEAVRRHIYTGAGAPPHWFGEPGQNLAEAKAMQNPAERHLKRRQEYLCYVVQDVLFQAYQRAAAVDSTLPPLPPAVPLDELIHVETPPVSRTDNLDLAQAAHQLAQAYAAMTTAHGAAQSRTLAERFIGLLFRFTGAPQPAAIVASIVEELTGAEHEEERTGGVA